jgi:hypothetical protein
LFCLWVSSESAEVAAEAATLGGSKPSGKSGKRRISMKKQILSVASLCLVVGLAVAPAYAQSGGVHAKIPFNFTVAGKTFPAGAYTMIVVSHQVNIRDADGRKIAMVLANEISGKSAGANGQIIFRCYSEHCFLSEVWSPTHGDGLQLLTPRSEADLAKKENGGYFAVIGAEPQK